MYGRECLDRSVPSAPRVVIYGRVSRVGAESARSSRATGADYLRVEGRSVDEQIAECERHAKAERWKVVGTFRDDGVSASRYARGKSREDWPKVMELITTRQVDYLSVWEISRATRDLTVWTALVSSCQASNVKIVSGGRISDPNDPDDGFMLNLTALLSDRESAMTSKRIRRTVAARAAEGRPHGRLPWGYRREYDRKTGALLRQVPDERQAPVIRDMARRVLAGEALYSVAQSYKGRWTPGQVRRVLVSPTYAGLRVHQGKVEGDADWEPIITPADHHRLVEKLTDPRRKTWTDGSVKHLLTNIAKCGVCGGQCRRVKNRNTPSYMCMAGFCVARSQATLDDYVIGLVCDRLAQPDVVEHMRAVNSEGDDVAQQAAEEQRALEHRLKLLRDEYVNGKVTLASFTAIEPQLTAKIEDAKQRARPKNVPRSVLSLTSAHARATFESLPTSAQREVVRYCLSITLMPTGKGTRKFKSESVHVEWNI